MISEKTLREIVATFFLLVLIQFNMLANHLNDFGTKTAEFVHLKNKK